jgi:hypothetical protein
MTPNDAPKGATRITFEVWSTAPWSKQEKADFTSQISQLAAEYDDDMVADSVQVRFENGQEIADAKRAEIAELLGNAEVTVKTKVFLDVDGLSVDLTEDDEE